MELFLVRVLGLGVAEAAAEAVSLQHVISPRVEQALAAHLGAPTDEQAATPPPHSGLAGQPNS